MKVDIQNDGYNSVKIIVNGRDEYRISVQSIGHSEEHIISINAHPGTLAIEPRAGNVVWISQMDHKRFAKS